MRPWFSCSCSEKNKVSVTVVQKGWICNLQACRRKLFVSKGWVCWKLLFLLQELNQDAKVDNVFFFFPSLTSLPCVQNSLFIKKNSVIVISDFSMYNRAYASYRFILFTFYFCIFVFCDNFWNCILNQSCWLLCIFYLDWSSFITSGKLSLFWMFMIYSSYAFFS